MGKGKEIDERLEKKMLAFSIDFEPSYHNNDAILNNFFGMSLNLSEYFLKSLMGMGNTLNKFMSWDISPYDIDDNYSKSYNYQSITNWGWGYG